MSSAIYNVGVHLTAHDGVSGVLASISHSMLGLHGGIHNLNKAFSSLQVGVLGAAAVAAGVKVGHVVEKLVEHGVELRHWQSQLSAAGFTAMEVAEATAAAWGTAGKNMNSTAAENLKNIIELNKATGDLHESMKLLPAFSVAENVIQSVKSTEIHAKLTKNGTQTLNFARGLEELGVTQMGKTQEEREANIKKYANEYLKTMIASRGLFDGNALYAMTNNSGGAAQNWDMRMATAVAPIIGDIMKASKFGNADYMAIKSYQGGHITGDAAEALLKYHLVKPNDLKHNDKGKVTGLKANTDFAKGMETNLWDWSGRILSQLKAGGMDISNQHQVNAMINEIGSNKSTTMMMRAILEPLTRLQIEKELKMRDKVGGDAAGSLGEQDPWMKLEALKKKWDDFLTALGGPLVDPAMGVLDKLTHSVNDWAQYLAKHPDLAAKIDKTLVAVSVGLTAIGSVAIGTAVLAAIGPAGWLIVGIAALGKGIADLHQSDWKDLSKFKPFGADADKFFADYFKGLSDGMKKDFGAVDAFMGTYFKNMRKGVSDDFAAILKEIQSWPDKMVAAITAMGKAFVDKFRDALLGVVLPEVGVPGAAKGAAKNAGPNELFPNDQLYMPNAYRGSSLYGGNLINAAFGGGASNDNAAKVLAGSVAISNANVILMGGGGLGGGSGGGGFGGGVGGLLGGGMRRLVGNIPNGEYSDAIRQASVLLGVDPNVSLRVYGREGRGNYVGDGGSSFGPFQLHYGGINPRMPHGGLGEEFDKYMHRYHAAMDPKTVPAQIAFALQHVRKHGWGAWMGARAEGIYGFRGVGPMPGPPPFAHREHKTVVPVHLDGKLIAKVVTRHQTKMASMPHAIGGHDDYGSWASPGTTKMPA